jgi:hypothetical protein
MSLTRDEIVGVDDITKAEVQVPEWGGTVYVKTLRGTDRDAFEESLSKEKDKPFRSRFLVMTLCDERGSLLFKPEQVAALGEKSSLVLNRVFDAAWAINYFTPEKVEELGKDSPSGQSDASTSA